MLMLLTLFVINDIFLEIRQRNEYISEVQSNIHSVLSAFQQDAQNQGRRIKFAANPPDTASGSTVELTEVIDGKGNGSSIVLEINCAGDVLVWRTNTIKNRPEQDEVERRPLDFSKPSISTAVDILLIMADDHRGFVGSKLESFLGAAALGQAPDRSHGVQVPEP